MSPHDDTSAETPEPPRLSRAARVAFAVMHWVMLSIPLMILAVFAAGIVIAGAFGTDGDPPHPAVLFLLVLPAGLLLLLIRRWRGLVRRHRRLTGR